MPGDATLLEIGLGHHRAGRLAEAEAAYLKLLAREPGNADALCLLGAVAHQVDEYETAVDYLTRAVAINPSVADYHNNLGVACRGLGRLEDAIVHYRQALALNPGKASTHCNLGVALEQRGEVDEALSHFEAALALDPGDLTPHFHLSEARRYEDGDPLFARIEAVLERPDLSAFQRSVLHFALAKMHDDCDRYADAFEHARIANELDRHPFDIAERAQFVQDTIATFSEAFFTERRAFGSDSPVPVFIVGMPRCGKSLVEQLIASHEDGHGAGELMVIHRIAAGLPRLIGTDTPYPLCAALLDAETAQALAEDYVERLAELSGGASRVCNTVPGNFLRLGLIALLFPKAKIIHLRRHPLDVGLACYLRNMNESLPFASDLAHIGQFHRLYEAIMEHWRRVLPMLELDYEELVTNPEPSARRILDFCGLDWDPACLAANYRSRPVQTRSESAKAPLERGFIGRWRHYDRFLGPLQAALGRPVL